MSKIRWLIAGAQIVVSAFILSMVVGCGSGVEVAGNDPVAREKSMTDAKNAMEAAGKLQKPAKTKRLNR